MGLRSIKENYFSADKGFYKKLLVMAVPIVAQNLITIGVNLTDTLMQGALGETQLSASSLATQFINMFQILVMGTSMGASVLVARYYGMNEKHSLRMTMAIMFRIILGIAAVFAALTLFAPAWVMHLYTTDDLLVSEGMAYLKFAVLTYFLHGLSQGSTIILRNLNKMKVPMVVSIASFLLNIAGNYIFMFGKLGFPAMGIAGASLSTLIVRCIECALNFGYLVVADQIAGFRLRHLFMKTRVLLKEYIRVSVPVLISDGLLAFGSNGLTMIIGRMGSHFVSANAVTAVVERLSTTAIGGIGQVGAIVTGQTMGMGDREKAMRDGKAAFGLGTVIGCVAAVVILLMTEPAILVYRLSGETAEITRQLMAASAFLVLFQAANGILTKGVLRGGGDTKALMVADAIFLWVFSLPLGYLAGLVWHLPPFWVFFFLRSENIGKTVWGVWRLESGKWMKKIRSYG